MKLRLTLSRQCNRIDKIMGAKKIKNTEKVLITGLAVAIGFFIYLQAVYKPLSRKINRDKFQVEKSQSKLDKLRMKSGPTTQQRETIRSLQAECRDLLEKITEIEKTFPGKEEASELLAELTRQARGLKLISIEQETKPDGKYSKIFVEFKFYAPYQAIVNYIKRLESISPFLLVEELDISESKGKMVIGGAATRLVLSSLLGQAPGSQKIKAEAGIRPLEVARDIFVSKVKPVAVVRKVDLKLEGITYSPGKSTAIINSEVIREGTEISNLIVTEIRRDAVILTGERTEQILTIAR